MRLRDLVPWRDFVIETSWSPDVTMVELAKRIGAPRLPFFGIDRRATVPFAVEAARSERILRGIFERAPALPPPDPPYETGEPYR
jgi:hypothetical protein